MSPVCPQFVSSMCYQSVSAGGCVSPVCPQCGLLVQQGDLAAVAVVAAHLAVGGGVEGGGGGGGGGVPWRGEHGLGFGGGGGRGGAVVLVLVLAGGWPAAKGLALGQLVPQGRDSFLLLEPQQ